MEDGVQSTQTLDTNIANNNNKKGNDTIILPGYEAQLSESGIKHSTKKLNQCSKDLWSSFSSAFIPASDNHNPIQVHPIENEEQSRAYRCSCSFQIIHDPCKEDGLLHYAMRQNKQPVVLNGQRFPIASKRIQRAMAEMISLLSSTKLPWLRRGLTSCSFVSSWNQQDCVVVLHYASPIDRDDWKPEACRLRDEMTSITTLIGRSKGNKIVIGLDPPVLRDRITIGSDQIIHYRKPFNAFQHPNPNAMYRALDWLLGSAADIMHCIQESSQSCASYQPSLLELYCGCGAHTLPLSKLRLFRQIVAVEFDERLVRSCRENCHLNKLGQDSSTPIHVISSDASDIARAILRKKFPDWWTYPEVLLVDPPRAGLDRSVCQLAISGMFRYVLYISCGIDALKRDVATLCEEHFEIRDCRILDLFPRTGAVETLVCLERRVR